MAGAGREGKLAQTILQEIHGSPVALEMYTDSWSAIAVTERRGPGRIKHLDLRALYLQDEVREGRLRMVHIGTAVSPADLLTKACKAKVIQNLLPMFGLVDVASPVGEVHVVLPRTLAVPLHCDVPMQMEIGSTGVVVWTCRVCTYRQEWSDYVGSERVSQSAVTVNAAGDLKLVAIGASESLGVASQRAAAAAAAAPSQTAGGSSSSALPVGGGASASSSSTAPPPKAKAATVAPKSTPAKALGLRASPPTQRQLDYIDVICGRLGLVFSHEMAGIHSKGDASRWIDQHVGLL